MKRIYDPNNLKETGDRRAILGINTICAGGGSEPPFTKNLKDSCSYPNHRHIDGANGVAGGVS